MQVLVVFAHPDPDSYGAALRDAAVRGLMAGGHTVTVVDLYQDAFVPAMTAEERRAYESETPAIDPQVAEHTELLRTTEALVFVYPTWWFGMPAIMKGWLERVFVPGVAFHLDERSNRVRSDLRNITRLVGITTMGSPRWQVRALGDGARWTIGRSARLLASWRCRTTWLSLDRLDRRRPEDRRAFLEKVEKRMASL